MHLRKLTLAISTIGAMCASGAYGLGLGEITLNSALNEPLDAEIKLLQVRDLSENEIIVELADRSDFERAGVDRIFFLQGLEFDVDLDNPGGPVVHVKSDRPVQEPFLNFLVKTQWPSGRLLREYTVLLDLPVFDRAPSQPVQPARTQRPAPQVQPAPAPAPVQTRPAPAPAQPTRADDAEPTAASEPPRAVPEAEYDEKPSARTSVAQPAPVQEPEPVRYDADNYQVQANDTLWEIALRTRPTRSSSVQQTMLALQRLNPDAFINNNINLLKKGQVLRIPSQSDIDALSLSEAVSEVAYQNSQWRSADSSVGAQLEGASTEISYDDEPVEQQGQLRIAAPSDTSSAGSQSGAGSSLNQEILENDLAINMEQLDSARRENDELNERVSELDEQIETIERLIDVSNAELSQLQQGIAQADMAEDAAAESDMAGSTEADSETSTDTNEMAQAEPQAQAAPEQKPVIRAKPPEPSLVDTLMGYIWYILAGIGVLAAILGFVIFQRRMQRDMEEFDSYEETDYLDQDDSLDDDFGDLADTEFDADEFDLANDELEEDLVPEEEPVAAAPVQSETGDAVAEADIYIAYGKFDQAEEMLVRALDDDPSNTEARLKLLEVYAETRDAAKFDAQYSQVIATGETSAEQRASELRNSIPGIAAFTGAAAAASVVADETDELNFDDFDQIEEPETPAASVEEGDDFDFGDLDLDLDGGESPTEESVSPNMEGDTGLDFDFDLEEESEDNTTSSDEEELSFDLDLDEPAPSGSSDADSLDFDLEADTAGGAEAPVESPEDDLSFDFDLGDDSASQGQAEPELSLDLDGDLESDDLSLDGLQTEDVASDDSLDLDLDSTEEDASSEFGDLELGDDGVDFDLGDIESETPAQDAAEEEDDFLADLEFSPTADEAQSTDRAQSGTDSDDLNFDFADDDVNALDDAFDLEGGDVDLAALDQEMDALVGGLDDDDDLDLEATPTEVVAQVTDDDLSGLDLGDAELSDADVSADLDDLISLDDSSLDDLTLDSDDISADSDTDDFSVDDLTFEGDDASSDDMDSELDFLADTDEVATKLDLARAYIDMGDKDGARDILEEVNSEGNDEQKSEAQELMGRL